MLPFKDGAYNLAKELEIPLLPVTLLIPEDIWERGSRVKVVIHDLVCDVADVNKAKEGTFRTIMGPLAGASDRDAAHENGNGVSG